MADEDPIRQLQHLLDDPSHLLERISRIQSVIGSIGEPTVAPARETPAAVAENPIDENPAPFENLLRMLSDMQTQIDQRVRPLALQVIRAESERLCELAQQERSALDECVARIDRTLIDCVDRVDEAQKIHAQLAALNGRLGELGASPQSLNDLPATQSVSTILQSRIDELHRQGKL